MQTKIEKPKHKHNKKRNTAFLYESLVKELTKTIVFGDKQKQKIISGIIKEHFKKNSILDKELTLYRQFYETKQFPKNHAEKLLREVQEQHDDLNEDQIFNEQSKLIAKINKNLGFHVYDNFIPNYRTLASISQIFNKGLEPKKKVILEQEIIEFITEEAKTEKKVDLEPVDKLVLKSFVKKFNETYDKALIWEQKELLSKYINSSEDDIELKIYLNEEIARLKQEVLKIKGHEIVKENVDLDNNVSRMLKFLDNLKIETVSEELIKKVMLAQEFVSEVSK